MANEIVIPNLGEIVLKEGYCTIDQIAQARERQRASHSKNEKELLQILIDLGHLTKEQARACERLAQGGTTIAGFEILEKVGQGGMGAVFRARQVSMDRIVALKVLPPKLAQDPMFKKRFLNEARASAKLSHLNIINGIDCGEASGFTYFAMEFVEGAPVSKLLKEKGKYDPPAALDIVRQMVEALGYAKRQGLVHRDVKPDNIMLMPNGTAKLCDLGLAKNIQAHEDSGMTLAGQAVGTPHYISPEQAKGESVDFSSDIYSLGATFYHMLTGRTPYNGPTSAAIMALHITEETKSPCEVVTGIPIGYGQVISKMMAKAKADRYTTPDQLLADLDAFLAGKAPSAASFKGKSSCQMPHLVGAAKAAPRGRTTGPQIPVGERPQPQTRPPRTESKSNQNLIYAAVAFVAILALIVVVARSGGDASKPHNLAQANPEAVPPVTAPKENAPPEPAARKGEPKPAATEPVQAVAQPKNQRINRPEPGPPQQPVAINDRPRPPLDADPGKAVTAPIAVPAPEKAAEQAEAAALAAAETVFGKYLTPFVNATLKNDVKTARKLAADAKADGELKKLAAKTHGLTEVCDALEKIDTARVAALEKLKDGQEHSFDVTKGPPIKGVVERVAADEIFVEFNMGDGASGSRPIRLTELKETERKRLTGEFKPQSAPEHLAQAIHALSSDDNTAAATELTAAKDYALTPAYQARLDEKLMGAVEAAAKAEFETIERDAGSGKLSEQKAKEIGDRLAAFEKLHGKTKFAASIRDRFAALEQRVSQQITLDLGNGVKLELVPIHPGKFTMGSPPTEAGRNAMSAITEVQHQVTLTQAFYMAKYPVTQEQYEQVMGNNPSPQKGPKNPVDSVSWNDAQEFCAKLSKKTDRAVKLPTEAQWEYACRAGTTTAYYFGDSDKDLGEYCWFQPNSEDRLTPVEGRKGQIIRMTHPVGLKKPNAWGLYDMHGNVIEWCQDWLDKYPDQPVVDPTGPATPPPFGPGRRVMRGGSCTLQSNDCRSAFRIGYPPERTNGHVGYFGFRIVIMKP